MNRMRPWRELSYGMQGAPDVKASQRGLWRLLDADSQNMRNGNYGDGTSADVALARQVLNIPGDSDSFGSELFQALQEWFDDTAWQLANNQPDAVTSPTPTCKRLPLTQGMSGKDIQGAQRALWRALQGDSTNARNGNFGAETARDIGKFRQTYGVNKGDSNSKIGADLWAVLTRWMDQTAVNLVHEQPAPKPPPAKADWQTVADEAWWAYQNKGRFTYAQVRPMPQLHSQPQVLTDCSGLYTACCQSAGVPNPNRSDGVYDGYGYTGTLQSHGKRTSNPRVGDCCLYGSGGTSSHAAVYMGDGTVVSFGSDPIKHLAYNYRSDFMGFWTYH